MGGLDDYDLEGLIGRGSTGAVYRARRQDGGQVVAVKRVRWVGEGDMVERVREEAAALAGLDHPHILRVIEVIADEEGLAIVMDLVDRGSLSAVVDRHGRLPPGEAMVLAAKVADALDASHGLGIVHGDVKPSNILVDGFGEPRLSDFGLSRSIAATSPWGGGSTGTAEYLDPEVAGGATPSAAGDVYALGVMCYELLSGRLPYRGATPGATLRAADRGRPEPLSQAAPGVQVSLAAVVEQAMARQPQARPATAGQLALALRSMTNPDATQHATAPTRAVPLGTAAAAIAGTAGGPRRIRPRQRSGEGLLGAPEPGRRSRAAIATLAVAATLVAVTLSGWAFDHGGRAHGATRSCRATATETSDDHVAPARASTQLAEIDGTGCRVPVTWSSGVITVSLAPGRTPVRFALGQPGDQLLLGDWDCRGRAKPAIYRPATGQIFYFAAWAEPGRDLYPSRERSTAITGGVPRVAHGGSRACDQVEVDRPNSPSS